jgi:DNA ligase (NAD+)
MGSMNKLKELEELTKWFNKLDGVSESQKIVVTPKLDGLALLVEFVNGKFNRAITRGDGNEGQDVTEHYKNTKLAYAKVPFESETVYVIGETIMGNDTFTQKYADDYANPRNLVAGVIGRKHISETIKDISFIAFDIKFKNSDRSYNKNYRLNLCNKHINSYVNGYELPFLEMSISQVSVNQLSQFKESIIEYHCDGLVIDINDKDICKLLGTETNSLNPKFARAWKPQDEETAAAVISTITWNTNKTGKVTPVVSIAPVELAGVTISKASAYNAKFVKDNDLQPGTVVLICRSGDVIPKILKVVEQPDQWVQSIPKCCSSCKSELTWSETNVDLMCSNSECTSKSLREIMCFFGILGVDNMGGGTITQLYEEGYDTVEKILKMRLFEFQDLDRFGNRKAEKVYNSIHAKMKNIKLHKLQHASNLFKGLGSRKLELLLDYNSRDNKPKFEDIVSIEGFSKKSADSYLTGFDKFWDWVEKLPITIDSSKPVEHVITDGEFTDEVVVFTGFRSPDLEEKIKSEGGTMGSGVNKKTTILVVKDKESTSSKMRKAQELGITILSRKELEQKIEEANPLFDL